MKGDGIPLTPASDPLPPRKDLFAGLVVLGWPGGSEPWMDSLPFATGFLELLFDLGVLLQAVDIFLKFLLHDGGAELLLHLVERRIARVHELDYVPAILGLHGLIGHIAFLHCLYGIAEGLDHARRREPAEVAAVALRIVGGLSLRDVFELRSALDLLDELIG